MVAASVFVLVDWLRLGGELPPLEPGASQRILDRHGREIRHALSLDGERRYVDALESVPERLLTAFLLAEDRRFFSHEGVDWRAIARGIYQSARQLRLVSGGSTITMQLVRTQWPSTRGLVHKPAQVLQALRLGARYSKAELLTRYLNTVPYGSQIAGVGAACRYFFNKSCDALSAGEMATLAILPRNPSLYTKNRAALIARRNKLLVELLGTADELTLRQAQDEPVSFVRKTPDLFAPHVTERILSERPGEPVVRTTIDLGLQTAVQELLRVETSRRKSSGDSGAVLVLDNATGEVLAYVGSPDYFEPGHGMVDGVRVLRSPGSALKPFVYELALENGWNLFSLVPDVPMVFSTQRAVYEPNNYGGNFSGPRTIREALGNSKNLPALYMMTQVGEARALEQLRRLGFESLRGDSAFYGVGLALGNGEVSLWELTQAYATLARLGRLVPSTYYRSESGPVVGSRRVLPEQAAYLIADVLRDPEARQEEFGRFGPLEFDFEVSVKTGTSSDYRDNWTVGFTRNVTVGVWRGNADSSPLEARVPASRGTGPLFHRVVELAHRNRVPRWLARPEGVGSSRVCAFSGQKPGPHCQLTRLELHLAEQPPSKGCEFHRELVVPNCRGRREVISYVELPAEYREWGRSALVPTLERQVAEKCGDDVAGLASVERVSAVLKGAAGALPKLAAAIVEPLDRTVYAVDPTMPIEHQEIRFALRGGFSGGRVFVNGRSTSIEVGEDEFFWPLSRGEHELYVMKGEVRSNVVRVLVR